MRGGMRMTMMTLVTRKHLRALAILLFCMTGLGYISLNSVFYSRQSSLLRQVSQSAMMDDITTVFTMSGKHDNDSMADRTTRIAEMCRDRHVTTFIRASPYILQKRLFYNRTVVCTCTVPKAASTSIGRLMMMAEFPERAMYYAAAPGNVIHANRRVAYYNTEHCSDKPGMSFFVTRDPYSRLYSAYVDKVFLEKFSPLTKAIKDALSRHRTKGGNPPEHNWCSLDDVSFEHFLYFVSRSRVLDPHYTPVSLLCNPCRDPVDYIFKQETLAEDSHYLFEYLNKTMADNRQREDTPLFSSRYNPFVKPDVDLHLKDYAGDNGMANLIRTFHLAWRMRMDRHSCHLSEQAHDAIYRRLWDAMKVLGNIDDKLEYIPEVFNTDDYQLTDPSKILAEMARRNLSLLNSEQRSKQRRYYLVKAYASVSKKVLKGIQRLFRLDFEFFQYDINPPV